MIASAGLLRVAAFATTLVVGTAAVAAGPEAPVGASSCSGCHTLRSSVTTSIPPIYGRPAEEIVAALEAFRTGARPATLMNRIVAGFSPEETRALAAWLSRQPAPR